MRLTLEAQWQDSVPDGKKIAIAGLTGEIWPEGSTWYWKVGRDESGWTTELVTGVADDEAEAIYKAEVAIIKEAQNP